MQRRVFAGRYQIGGLLGRGQFGSVWHAYDENMGRECALKLFRSGAPVFQAFYEARILTSLRGHFILQVYDADVYMDVPYLATALAPLGSTDKLATPYGVSPAVALRWARDALVGLDVCHRQRLLHRDVKPANLFLHSEDRVQLGDFGVAAVLDQNDQASPHGDPRVRAPEMYRDGVADVRSDIYSVGVTLYTLLVGRYPHQQREPDNLDRRIVDGDYEPLHEAAPHVPRALTNCVRKAMSLDPSDRYKTAEAMSAALSRVPPIAVSWQRVQAHAAHYSCWQGKRSGDRGLHVCVEHQRQFSIETLHAGSGQRIRRHCHEGLPRRRLGSVLRRIFRDL